MIRFRLLDDYNSENDRFIIEFYFFGIFWEVF